MCKQLFVIVSLSGSLLFFPGKELGQSHANELAVLHFILAFLPYLNDGYFFDVTYWLRRETEVLG